MAEPILRFEGKNIFINYENGQPYYWYKTGPGKNNWNFFNMNAYEKQQKRLRNNRLFKPNTTALKKNLNRYFSARKNTRNYNSQLNAILNKYPNSVKNSFIHKYGSLTSSYENRSKPILVGNTYHYPFMKATMNSNAAAQIIQRHARRHKTKKTWQAMLNYYYGPHGPFFLRTAPKYR